MEPIQCKLGRIALGWGIRDLAKEARVAPGTVTRFEGGSKLKPRTIDAIRTALEAAGIEFIPENGGGPGLRVRKGH